MFADFQHFKWMLYMKVVVWKNIFGAKLCNKSPEPLKNGVLAILYNDRSVLENHHVAASFKMLQDNRGSNIVAELTRDQFEVGYHMNRDGRWKIPVEKPEPPGFSGSCIWNCGQNSFDKTRTFGQNSKFW